MVLGSRTNLHVAPINSKNIFQPPWRFHNFEQQFKNGDVFAIESVGSIVIGNREPLPMVGNNENVSKQQS